MLEVPEGETVYQSTLECEAENCGIRVPLIAQWSETTSEAERVTSARAWIWENLRCPNGHSMTKPKVAY